MARYLLTKEEAFTYTRDLFMKAGVSEEDASIVADNLVFAELRGVYSHGLSRIGVYLRNFANGGFNKAPKYRIIRETISAFSLDADGAPGAVVGTYAMKKCIEKAKTSGACFGAVGNCNHYGMAGYYSMMAIPENMIGFSCCNALAVVAPYGGKDRFMGTNPFSVAIPTCEEHPFFYDGATSVVAQGKVMVAVKEKRPIPLGWALDVDGNPTTDADRAFAGTMIPFGGYKGSNISMIVDIISSLLSNASISSDITELNKNFDKCMDNGLFFGALNVEAFTDVEKFKKDVDAYIRRVKSTSPAPGFEEILVAGEKEFRKLEEYSKTGFTIGAGVCAELDKLAEDYGVRKFERVEVEG